MLISEASLLSFHFSDSRRILNRREQRAPGFLSPQILVIPTWLQPGRTCCLPAATVLPGKAGSSWLEAIRK